MRTAGTTYLVYRGRHEHHVSRETPLRPLAGLAFRSPVLGPRELFYADLFASRETGCRSQLGLPGVRDQHTGCVGAWLAARDLFDFLLLSLPDNDTHSHKHGPTRRPTRSPPPTSSWSASPTPSGGLDAASSTPTR